LRILVKHPDTVEGMQKQRMITTLDTIYNSIYEDGCPARVELRCYRQPFSLRGRRFGKKLLELGWLTVDAKRQMAFGHSNPSIVVDLTTTENEYLLRFFERTFDDLWNDPTTEDGKKVLARLQIAPPASSAAASTPS
jgi:hypothetical protein